MVKKKGMRVGRGGDRSLVKNQSGVLINRTKGSLHSSDIKKNQSTLDGFGRRGACVRLQTDRTLTHLHPQRLKLETSPTFWVDQVGVLVRTIITIATNIAVA